MENMTTREKVEHIWYYYKIHIIAGIIGLVLLSNLVYSIATNKTCVLNVTLLGQYINTEKVEMMETEMISKFIDNPKKNTAELLFINYSRDAQDQMAMAGIQKFQAMAAAKSIDIVVLDKDTFDVMVQSGAFYNLDEVKDIDLTGSPELKPVKLQIEGASTPGTYGVEADGIKAFKDLDYDTQDKIMCILANTTHLDNAAKCFNWLLKQ